MLGVGVDWVSRVDSGISRYSLHYSQFVHWFAACCHVYLIQELQRWYASNPVSVCRIAIGSTSEPNLSELFLILRPCGSLVSNQTSQKRLCFICCPIRTAYFPAFPIELDLKWGGLVFLVLNTEWRLVLNLIVLIATVMVGVLVGWVWVDICETEVGLEVPTSTTSVLLVCVPAFVDFLWKLLGGCFILGIDTYARP